MMASAGTDATIQSKEKKRLRDRRAQNALRARRDNHVRALEARLAMFESEDRQVQDANTIRDLFAALQEVRAETAELRRLLGNATATTAANNPSPLPLAARTGSACLESPSSLSSASPPPSSGDGDSWSVQSPIWSQLPQSSPDAASRLSLRHGFCVLLLCFH
jgi:glutathione S-transferase